MVSPSNLGFTWVQEILMDMTLGVFVRCVQEAELKCSRLHCAVLCCAVHHVMIALRQSSTMQNCLEVHKHKPATLTSQSVCDAKASFRTEAAAAKCQQQCI